MGNCSVSPLDDDQDSISLANSAGMALTMKDPKQFFHIDDTYFYAGQVKLFEINNQILTLII